MKTIVKMCAAATIVAMLTPGAFAADDDRLASSVRITLLTAPDIDGTRITVHSNDAAVFLYGSVDSEAAKRKAEDIARNTAGVKNVQNELTVRPAMNSLQAAVEDDLRTAEPAQGPGLSSQQTPPGGGAGADAPTPGNVPGGAQGATAPESAARSDECIGAAYRARLLDEPVSKMRVGVSDTELRRAVTRALENDPLLASSQIQVASVSNGTVRLTGHAKTIPVHQRAIETALVVDGVCRVATDVTSAADASAALPARDAPLPAGAAPERMTNPDRVD